MSDYGYESRQDRENGFFFAVSCFNSRNLFPTPPNLWATFRKCRSSCFTFYTHRAPVLIRSLQRRMSEMGRKKRLVREEMETEEFEVP